MTDTLANPLSALLPVEARPTDTAPIAPEMPLGARIPALDGLRGLAILLVMMHHFALYGDMQPERQMERWIGRVAGAGWIGVDLFFVLSGFLITGILLDTKRQGHFFRTFYMRRVLRIFPLYYACLVIVFWVAPAVVPPSAAYQSLLMDQHWYWSYLTNVRIALWSWPPFYLIGHFWSLAVEEQFYLFWPLVVYRLRRRTLAVFCIAILPFSLLIRTGLGIFDYRTAAYVLTLARMDTLAVGALIALLLRSHTDRRRLLRVSLLVIALAAAAILLQFLRKLRLSTNDAAVYTLGFPVLALFFGAMLIVLLLLPTKSLAVRFFSSNTLRFFGRYSYGLYVWHHIVAIGMATLGLSVPRLLPFVGAQLPALAVYAAVAMLASITLALVSWHLLEAPFLALKRRFDYQPMPDESTAKKNEHSYA